MKLMKHLWNNLEFWLLNKLILYNLKIALKLKIPTRLCCKRKVFVVPVALAIVAFAAALSAALSLQQNLIFSTPETDAKIIAKPA